MIKIFIKRLDDNYKAGIEEGFAWVGVRENIRCSDAVSIKPNLTFPHFRPGVMTNPNALEALIAYLKNYTDRITICESDSGGYNRFSMDEVFKATGIADMARRYGVRIVNLSYEPSREIQVKAGIRNLSVQLPTILLDETDLFITVPVPKVHLNTGVSIAMKNQWGVIQDPALRLKLHPYFKKIIYEVNKSLPKTLVVVDGKYGLTRSGPLSGDVVNLNWVLISDSVFYADFVVTELMGLSYHEIPYLKYAFEKEGIKAFEGVDFNTDYRQFKREQFCLKRKWTDYPGVLTFNSRTLAYIGYESFLAKPLHWLLYRFRKPFY